MIPALVVSALVWLYMLSTGLLYLEATLWMPDGAHFLSMAQRFFGSGGKWVIAITFLFLYYALEVAYVSGGSPVISSLINKSIGLSLDAKSSAILFTLVIGIAIAFGTQAVDRVNWLLMIGFFSTLGVLFVMGFSEVESILFTAESWWLAIAAFPVLFGAYGYQNLIPTLTTYLNRNAKKLRLSIIIGITVPLIIYSLWQMMMIETIGSEGLQRAMTQGIPITQVLAEITHSTWIRHVATFFGFFALVTSMLGVSLAMVDFIADGFKIMNRSGIRRVGLTALALFPPMILALIVPGIFNTAMGIAGGFGETLLNGIFPVLVVWMGRYVMNLQSEWRLPGGKGSLLVLLIGGLGVAGVEIANLFLTP
jgi:tyrosine-specific transport protein